MVKYKILMHYDDGTDEEQDEVFDTEASAEEYALYLVGCCSVGAEIMHLSNLGDYAYNEADFESPTFDIIRIDD